jgi:hypothetical protein
VASPCRQRWAIAIAFQALLTADQYARLYDCIRNAETRDELRECISQVASEWGIQVAVSDA